MTVEETNPAAVASLPTPFLSLEIYACEPTTHETVARQIKNWVRSEKAIWQELSYYSTILTSVDERRVVHLTGWKPRSLATANGAFEDLRRRASS
eukprot:scaffold1944_cov239-Ochromonas_danica.AAC.2